MFWFGAAFGLSIVLLIAASGSGTPDTLARWVTSNSLGNSGIVQPGPGDFEIGQMDWGTVILRVPDNINTNGNGNGTHLMILAGQPGQAVGQPGMSDASGGSITIKGANGVGTNGFGGSVSIYGGDASGAGMPGAVWLQAPTIYLRANQFVLTTETNAPSNTSQVAKWIAVEIEGDTNVYRWPLYK